MTRRPRTTTPTVLSSTLQPKPKSEEEEPPSSAPKTTAVSVLRHEQWQCDYCKVQCFPTLQQACDHEAVCSANPAPKVKERQPQQLQQTNQPAVHPFFQKTATATTTARTRTKPNVQVKATKKRTKTTTTKAIAMNTDTSLPNENTWMSARRPRSATEKAQCSLANDGNTNTATTASASARRPPRTTRAASSAEIVDLSLLDNDKDDDENAPARTHQKLPRRGKAQTTTTSTTTSTTTTATTVDAAVLAEQRALEFFAQRRMQQQRERERRQQRAAAAAAAIELPATTTRAAPIQPQSSNRNSKAIATAWAIPRFPNPAHVVGETSGHHREGDTPICSAAVEDKQLSGAVPATPILTIDTDNDDDVASYPHLFSTADRQSVSTRNDENSDDVLRQALLQETLVVTKINNVRKDAMPAAEEYLWVDKYLRTETAVSSLSSLAEQQLTEFIERFMVERHKVETRMAAKRQPTIATKKRKTVNYYRDDEDDLWEDDDDDDRTTTGSSSSLCLLTGPVGSGKTQLVHRVARRVGCRTVLELHPGVPRGAAVLKRRIQEATRSHSTRDLLKLHNPQQQQPPAKKSKPSATTWLPASKPKPMRERVDSDSEEFLDDFKDDAAEEDEVEKAQGASVTVILLDEVDNLYEEHGDNGFWVALSELCKGSKCPIVLTANSWPKAMESSAFLGHNTTFITVDTPSPAQCAEILYDIAVAEQHVLSFRGDPATAKTNLQRVAKLGNCDLRRLVHELQLFASAPTRTCTATATSMARSVERVAPDEPASVPHEAQESPTVDSVRPVRVPADEYSLLTITGSNFHSMAVGSGGMEKGCPCRVWVGNHECPLARIMDNTTILAVGPPCHFSGLNRHSNQERSRAACHAAVTVAALHPAGMISSSNESLLVMDAPDGRRILSTKPIVSLEYHFPGQLTYYFDTDRSVSTKNVESDDDGKSSENEWEWSEVASRSKRRNQPVFPGRTTESTRSILDDQTVPSELLQEGIDAWFSVHGTAKHPQTQSLLKTCEAQQLELDQMDQLLFERQLASDAALLEDIGSSGLPFLAGASRGFGYNLTDDHPRLTNESNKRPMEETLILSGCKDDNCFYGQSDAYMTLSMAARERNCLKQHERAARGYGFAVAPMMDEEHENDNFGLGTYEEDLLLPNRTPDCIADLPAHLRTMLLCSTVPPATAFEIGISTRSKNSRADKTKDILCDFVFVRRDDTRLFFRSMSRACDPLLGPGNMEPQLFLDYLPILRSISVQDRILEAVHNAAQPEDSATNQSSRRQRTTRQTSKRGHVHYLETLVPPQTWRGSEQSAKQVRDYLADASLLYVHKSAKSQ